MKQFRYFANLYEKIKHVPGDVVECGLGEGNTFAMLAYLIGSEKRRQGRTLHGFDSFEGWPEPTSFDASPRNPTKGEWRVSEEMVRIRLEESKIIQEFPWLEIRIVKGFFSITLPNFRRPIAFLHIDADLYPGYRDAMKFLFPLVSEGGVIAFDEYREFPNLPEYGMGTTEKWPGATKAVDEFLSQQEPCQTIDYWPETRKYYLIRRTS